MYAPKCEGKQYGHKLLYKTGAFAFKMYIRHLDLHWDSSKSIIMKCAKRNIKKYCGASTVVALLLFAGVFLFLRYYKGSFDFEPLRSIIPSSESSEEGDSNPRHPKDVSLPGRQPDDSTDQSAIDSLLQSIKSMEGVVKPPKLSAFPSIKARNAATP